MTNSHSKLFSQSRPQGQGVTGSLEQTTNIPKENLYNSILSKVPAAVTFINHTRTVQQVFAPRFLPTIDGSPPTTILGNSHDQIGWFSPAKMDIASCHFLGLLGEADMDLFGFDKPSPIPEDVASANGLTGGNFYLVSSMKFLIGHFQQQFPTGSLVDVQHQLEANGPGFEAYIALIKSVDTPDKLNKIKSIFEHPTIQAAADTFIINKPNVIDLQGPVMTVSHDSFQQFPDQLGEIRDIFQPSDSPSSPNNGATVVHEITTNQDRQETFAADAGLTKFVLANVGAKINLKEGTIDLNTVSRPKETEAMEKIKATPTGSRKDIFYDSIFCLANEVDKSSNAMDKLNDITIKIIPSDACNMMLHGKFQSDLLGSISDAKQFTGGFGAVTFMPQDPNDALIAKLIQTEETERSFKQVNPSDKSTSRPLRLVISTLDKVKEDSSIKILINGRFVFSILVDFDAMAKDGSPSIFSQLSMELIAWMVDQTLKRNAKWRLTSQHEMPHLAWVYFMWTDLLFVHFGRFASSLHNRQIITDPKGDLTKLDFSELKSFMKGFQKLKDDFESKQSMHAPHTTVPAIARSSLNMNELPSPYRPAVSFNYLPTKPDALADRISRQQQADRSQGTQRAANVRTQDTQRAPKKQKTQEAVSNGILILYDGSTLAQALPAGLNACPEFVTRGYTCPRGNACTQEHWVTLSAAATRQRASLCKHLKEKKSAYINKWKLGNALSESDPEFAGIVGVPSRPPTSSSNEEEESVKQIHHEETFSEAPYLMNCPSKSFFRSHHTPAPPSSLVLSPVQRPVQASRPNAEPTAMTQQPSSETEATSTSSSRLISSSKQVNEVLATYDSTFRGSSTETIVTTAQGKSETASTARVRKVMPPRQSATYRVEDLNFELIVLPLFASGFLGIDEYYAMEHVNQRLHRLVPKHLKWFNLETSLLQEPRFDYAAQTCVQQDRVDMASAQFIRFGGDPGKLVRFCAQEFTLQHLDREGILSRVKQIIPSEDYTHMERVLYEGCPAEFRFDEGNRSRLRSFARGNQPSYTRNMKKVKKAMNKEDKHSHVIVLDEDLAYFSAYCRHTPQGAVDKPNKSFRIVWDGSTKQRYDDVVLNEVTPIDNEAPITFGHTERHFDSDIYNLRVSYPDAPILLGTEDVTSCFKFARIHPDLSGAFGFHDSQGFYHLATAMVFGSVVSANQWEPFRRSVEILSKAFQDRDDLVEKHKEYLDMIEWDDDIRGPYVKAKGCAMCPGVLDENGLEKKRPARVYVDDALLAAIGRMRMLKLLAATIEAIFCVMGYPDTSRRRCALSLEKLEKLKVGPYQVLLGLFYDTIKLTKGTTLDYRLELLAYINKEWPSTRHTFTAHDMQILVGKLARLAKGARWVYHILSHSYDQIAIALASNYQLLHYHSPRFKGLISCIKKGQMGTNKLSQDSGRIVAFALKQASQLVHRSKSRHSISELLRADIEFFRWALLPESGIPWSSPLAHIVPRTPIGVPFGDSCLTGCGGYCTELKFWWHLTFPDDIVLRTLIHLSDDSEGNLISINALEFVTVILNYCATITVLAQCDILQNDPYPVILCMTDNTSALNWINHRCKGSALGRALGMLFVGLLMDSPLGINAAWLNTHDNEVADEIHHDTIGLSALVTELTPALVHLSSINHSAKSNSRGNKELGTERARQAHYIAWCIKHKVKDPVGPALFYKQLVGMYLHAVRLGDNYYNQASVRSKTLRGYAEAVNQLFHLRHMPLPYVPGDKSNDCAAAIDNLADEETIANQRSPLTEEIAAECLKSGKAAHPNSASSLITNILCLARYVGPRLSEYAQKQQNKVTYHTWKSGNKMVRSWILQDFKFFDKKNNQFSLRGRTRDDIRLIHSEISYMTITWRIQKNRRNGQSIKIPIDKAHIDICPVYHALQIVMRKFRLDPHNLDAPLCVFANGNSTDPLYLTGAKVKTFLQKAVQTVHPNISMDELKKFSAHSLRVWACVLLDQAGKSPSYIQQRLRWQGDSYRLYLRDTLHSSQAHCKALSKNTENIISAISTSSEGTIDASNPYDVEDMD